MKRMKRSLLALALALTNATAFAQSRGPEADESLLRNQTRVELYGILDGGIERVQNGDNANATRLQSGISAGSRLGFRGTENLGEGVRALFVLEKRIEIDTGSNRNGPAIFRCSTTAGVLCPGVRTTIAAPSPAAAAGIASVSSSVNSLLLDAVTTVNAANSLFDRQAFVGLVTPGGAILVGRQYTPGYEILNRFNAFADATSGQLGQGYSVLTIRTNNAVQYRAELAGITFSAMYGFGGTETNRTERTRLTRGDDFLGANLFYNSPDWGIGIAYNVNNTVTYAQPDRIQIGHKTLNVGGRVNLGPVRLFGQYMNRENNHPVLTPEDVQNIVVSAGCLNSLPATCQANVNTIVTPLYINFPDVDSIRGVPGKTDTNLFHLGAIVKVGNGDIYVAWNHANDKANDSWDVQDATVNHYAVAYFHNLSRRTQVYGVYATAQNGGSARVALSAAGYAGGFTTAPGQNAQVVQLGIRHAF